jgi:hypothetical protein
VFPVARFLLFSWRTPLAQRSPQRCQVSEAMPLPGAWIFQAEAQHRGPSVTLLPLIPAGQ